MKFVVEEYKQLKKTKSITMSGNQYGCKLDIWERSIIIPMSLVFQVKRGLESYTQKYYRKNVKKTKTQRG